ncbi:glutaminase A [Sutcliffiella rhizosphaerae]|uniref:Glutaminase n=1 Tax=Sutcliffiella rhizosphaerae TaxID=2880967 RepID=A0ABN8AB03_9BACI|nr:glutaminase A [Sutcliffiella rhizosphaerae]CAG9619855.1 Glutaminase 2 [Sutcliffiella rhizosphaerae]
MACRSEEELQSLVDDAKKVYFEGKVANYIPALQRESPDYLSCAIAYPDGNCISAGDIKKQFTLQSISKIITLALVLIDFGPEHVFHRVGMEPTGDPFNSIIKLETSSKAKPLNPMINAGALAVTSMIKGRNAGEKVEYIIDFVKKLTNESDIDYCEEVAISEFTTSFLNRSLCYYMKGDGVIHGNVEEIMEVYTKQCAIRMNCLQLARVGLIFSMDGVSPYTGEQIIPKDIARICKTFMVTCGMYNASGEFAIKIGIPAKSGVSGGIMGSVPDRMGIGIFGPALNEVGNSHTGMKLLELLQKKFDLSMF